MASPPPNTKVAQSPSARLRLHDNSAAAARHSIIHSSAKGWSPLNIHKRAGSGTTTPVRPQATGESNTGSTRRTSSSYRHMATNSLVANSPFKNLTTREGQLSNGIESSSPTVIHERHTPSRQLGQAAPRASGSANTPKTAIGLGATKIPGPAVSGTRKVSNERKVSIAPVSGRKTSLERKDSGSKENSSPEKNKKRRTPRQSMAYRALVENEYVTHSPFLSERKGNSPGDDDEENDEEVLDAPPSPSPRRVSSGSNRRRASPSAGLAQGRMSDSPTTSPQKTTSQSSQAPIPSPLREASEPIALPSVTPTKSSLAQSKRLLGPRGQLQDSPTRKTVTFRNVPEVKEFDPPSADTSLNLSYDQVDLGEEEWEDEGDNDEWNDQRNQSIDSQNSEDMNPDESATALFMDSLIEEGLFSPPELDTPAFADQASFELPMEMSPGSQRDEGTVSTDVDYLPTPSLGDDTPLMGQIALPMPPAPHHAHTITPHLPPGEQPNLPHSDSHTMLLNADAHQPVAHKEEHIIDGPHAHQDGPMYDPFLTIQTTTEAVGEAKERTEDGVPLGRTSHAERVHAARMLATQKLGLGYPGSLPTATPVVQNLRSEEDSDNSPAPRSAQQPPPDSGSDVFGEVIASPAARKISARQVSDAPELQGTSRRMAQFKSQKTSPPPEPLTPKRTLPRPPAAAPLSVPSVVEERASSPLETSESDADSSRSAQILSAKREDLQFTLPAIGSSPLLSSDAVFEQAAPVPERQPSPEMPSDIPQRTRRVSDFAPKLDLSPDIEESMLDLSIMDKSASDVSSAPTTPTTNADDEPLTPPTRRREVREESPRIPSFEFGDLSIDVNEDDSAGCGSAESSASTVTSRPETFATAPSPQPPSTPKQASSAPGTPTPASPMTVRPRTPGTPGGRPTAASPLSSPPVNAPTSMLSEFGPATTGVNASDASTNTRIRQRISRDAIRENVNKRMAAEGRPQSVMVESSSPASASRHARSRSIPDDMGASPSKPTSPGVKFGAPSPLRLRHDSPLNKALPLRPGEPSSPRSPTALDRLRLGGRDSPKSALDRIMTSFGHDQTASLEKSSPVVVGESPRIVSPVTLDPPSKVVQPVSILRTAEQEHPPLAQSVSGSIVSNANFAGARRSRRRSASAGEADIERQPSTRRGKTPRISLGINEDGESILESMNNDFDMISNDRTYRVVEQKRQVRATYTESLRSQAGDLDAGRAWRAVHDTDSEKRARQRALAAARDAEEDQDPQGRLFVRILGIQSITVPLPAEPTFFRFKLSNGVDYVNTPFFMLQEGVNINQEFMITETKDNQFTILLNVRQDPHVVRLVRQLRESTEPRLAPPSRTDNSSLSSNKGGIRGFFASPRKPKPRPVSHQPIAASAPPPRESIANHMGGDKGDTLGKTNITIEPIAKDCELRPLEIRYPVFSMVSKLPDGSRQPLAKVTVQLCRVPHLPGVDEADLPNSFAEINKGLEAHEWHKKVHNEGKLTQTGGDCAVPRRRLMRLVGGYLHAVNEVTRKEVSTIDLSLAVEITDLNAVPREVTGDYDPYAARPRSFQLRFTDGETIAFTADKDEDKVVW